MKINRILSDIVLTGAEIVGANFDNIVTWFVQNCKRPNRETLTRMEIYVQHKIVKCS